MFAIEIKWLTCDSRTGIPDHSCKSCIMILFPASCFCGCYQFSLPDLWWWSVREEKKEEDSPVLVKPATLSLPVFLSPSLSCGRDGKEWELVFPVSFSSSWTTFCVCFRCLCVYVLVWMSEWELIQTFLGETDDLLLFLEHVTYYSPSVQSFPSLPIPFSLSPFGLMVHWIFMFMCKTHEEGDLLLPSQCYPWFHAGDPS